MDAGRSHGAALMFEPEAEPRWPDWDSGAPAQWHGLMTSTVAAGNGWLSHGLYRGIASIIAGRLQANPALTPLDVRGLLLAATEPARPAPARRRPAAGCARPAA